QAVLYSFACSVALRAHDDRDMDTLRRVPGGPSHNQRTVARACRRAGLRLYEGGRAEGLRLHARTCAAGREDAPTAFRRPHHGDSGEVELRLFEEHDSLALLRRAVLHAVGRGESPAR